MELFWKSITITEPGEKAATGPLGFVRNESSGFEKKVKERGQGRKHNGGLFILIEELKNAQRIQRVGVSEHRLQNTRVV